MKTLLSKLQIGLLIALLLVQCIPVAFAAEKTGTLRVYLHSVEDGTAIQNAKLEVYKIADYNGQDTVLTEDFASTGITLSGFNEDLSDCAELLDGYISKSEVQPARTGITGSDGYAVFDSLENGVYYVCGVNNEDIPRVINMKSFVAALPTLNDGILTRDITCKPKCEITNLTDISVTKVWKDSTDDSRPKSVEILLYDGETLLDTVKLSEENMWTYVWKKMDVSGKYSVKEKVPTGYTASIAETDKNVFVVTNTKVTPLSTFLPQTGQLWWSVPVLLTVGLLMLLLGWRLKRKDSRENH